MKNTLKLACLVIYGLGVVAWVGLLPPGVGTAMQWLALALLVAHAVEAVLMFRYVRRYAGPLWVSVVLTLLFGLLHWKPLARKAAR